MSKDDKYVFGKVEAWYTKSKVREARRKGVGTSINKYIIKIIKDFYKESDTDDMLLLAREIAVDLASAIDTDLAKRHGKALERKAKRKATRKNKRDKG